MLTEVQTPFLRTTLVPLKGMAGADVGPIGSRSVSVRSRTRGRESDISARRSTEAAHALRAQGLHDVLRVRGIAPGVFKVLVQSSQQLLPGPNLHAGQTGAAS